MKYKEVKKFFYFFLFLFCGIFSCFSNSDFEVKEFVLENSMHVFVLEDYSMPVIRIEYTSKSGFSKQSPQNVGFFSLYSKLFKYATLDDFGYLDDLQCECNSDSSRYIITVTNNCFLDTLKSLAQAAFNPMFSNTDLEREFLSLKKYAIENINSIEGFINSAIDSKVFAESPWKHDSGIYPSIFEKMTTAQVRAILSSIQKNYYTPSNSALFISGPVNAEYVLKNVTTYFGQTSIQKNKIDNSESIQSDTDIVLQKEKNQEKKLFVLSDPEFSQDMTQIVVQYTNLSMEQADFVATIMNQDDSKLKNLLLEKTSLRINSSQYIDVASTHKNKNSRVIVQSLLSNKNVSPCKNSKTFISSIIESINLISQADFENAKELLINSFYASISNSVEYMNMLSLYWAIDNYQNIQMKFDLLHENFFARPQNLRTQSFDLIKENLLLDEPYVFVLINSKFLEKYKKEFINSGYEIITAKNGSWYTNQLYETLKQNQIQQKKQTQNDFENENFDEIFIKKCESFFDFFELDNNIQIVTYEKPATKTVCFSAMILGGQIADVDQMYGLESVLVDLLCVNVQNVLYQKYMQKQLKTLPTINAQTSFKSSIICIECLSEDLPLVIESFSESIISSDIIPSVIDSIVMQKKSDQIVTTSSSVFQLYANAITTLLKNKEYSFVYLQKKDILKNVSFNQILKQYQKFLNANKYKFIIVGNFKSGFNFDGELKQKLNQSFGFLMKNELQKEISPEFFDHQKKVKKVKLSHLFLTDVSKEKAGPRPQVLIPTKEFFDPSLYVIKVSQNDIVKFNALLNTFVNYLQKKIDEQSTESTTNQDTLQAKQRINVKAKFATKDEPIGVITFLNVKSIFDLEEFYKTSFENFFNDEQLIKSIKTQWIKNNFDLTYSNYNSAFLIYNYLDDDSKNKKSFLRDYILMENFSQDDFLQLSEKLNFDSIYKFYSADTKLK